MHKQCRCKVICFTVHSGVIVVFPNISLSLVGKCSSRTITAIPLLDAALEYACAPQWNYCTAHSKLDFLCLHGNQKT